MSLEKAVEAFTGPYPAALMLRKLGRRPERELAPSSGSAG